MTAAGPQRVPTEWVARIASLVAAIRHDWDEPGIRATLARVADQPLAAVVVAAVTAAATRTDQRSPAVIAATGSHWPAFVPQRATEPGIVTSCLHGVPGAGCPDCHPRTGPSGIGPTAEQRAAIRAGIREGQAALTARAARAIPSHVEDGDA